MLEAHEHAPKPGQPLDAGMGGGDAMADSGGAGVLALAEGIQHVARIQPEIARRDLGDPRQGLALVGRAHAQGDRAAIEKFADLHDVYFKKLALMRDPSP